MSFSSKSFSHNGFLLQVWGVRVRRFFGLGMGVSSRILIRLWGLALRFAKEY